MSRPVGLHASVWERFQARFALPRILELYAATEGSVSLYNCEGKPGAIGRVPPFLAQRFPLALIRVDPEMGEPVREADGFCIPCAAGEAGEAIGRVDRHRHPRPGASTATPTPTPPPASCYAPCSHPATAGSAAAT